MHFIVAVIAAFGILWALTIWIAGGFTIVPGELAFQSHDPLRPLAVGLAAAIIYLVTRGPLNFRRLVTPLAVLLALCPAAACWSVAIYFTRGTSKRSALAAGLAASVAILIRPSLAPLAAVLSVEHARHDCALTARRLPRAGRAGACVPLSIPRIPRATC